MAYKSLLLALFAMQASAAPVLNESCRIAWDYSTVDQERIDGFRFIANGKSTTTAAPESRSMTCGDLKLPEGKIVLTATAFAGEKYSPPSNALEFRYSTLPLPAPGKARLVIVFPEATN